MTDTTLSYAHRFGLAGLLACISAVATAQDDVDVHNHAQLHADLGMEAAEYSPGHANLCNLEMVFRNVNVLKTDPPRASSASNTPARNTNRRPAEPVPPMKVFDNLYFVGSAQVSAWLLGTEDGYILIDAMNTDDDAKSVIEAGIVELGLDPKKIRYLLITHAHGDHYGGFRYIKDTYDPEIVMSETDWVLASQLQEHPRFGFPPEKDVSVIDGDTLTVGATEIDIHVTPGHTMGTISPIFTVYDNGQPYKAVLWGGTGFNFGPNLGQMNAYATSAARTKEIAIAEDVQVFLANHPRRDGALENMEKLRQRGNGEPHPFVDRRKVHAALDVLNQCALAQADRIQAEDL
jgi:metallo-beta-lactamase class B